MMKMKLVPVAVAVAAAIGSFGIAGTAAANAAPATAAITVGHSMEKLNPGPPKTPCNQRNDGQTTVGSDGSIWECKFENDYFHWVQID
ncbi:hypothetical protein [Nocardia wallacei]|uniref:hypothetical protein n=1 Tax=Nocardia wallacei TaxID=480035 RepID=UPI0024578172|nr:hypothetical protein [Nocardia wallacei]